MRIPPRREARLAEPHSIAGEHASPRRRLRVQVEEAPSEHWVTLSGELDAAGAPGLQAAAARLLAEPCELVIDMREVTFIDSAGLGAILTIRGLCIANGVPLSLTHGTPSVMRTFRRSGLIEHFAFLDRPRPPREGRSDAELRQLKRL